MSKRISNSRSRTKARNNRIRIGWRKQAMIDKLETLREKDMDDQIRGYLHAAKKTLGKVFPTRFFRHQSR